MSTDLTPYELTNETELELYGDLFMVPTDWTSCGQIVHINGAPGIPEGQPYALALTKNDISLCTPEGPVWSLPIAAIKSVTVEELRGISFSINTPSGMTEMVPPVAYGISIGYLLTTTGFEGELTLYTLTAKSANGWKQDIVTAIDRYSKNLGSGPDRR